MSLSFSFSRLCEDTGLCGLTVRKIRRSVHLWPSGNWWAPSYVSVRVSIIRAVPLHGPAIRNPSPLSSAAGKVYESGVDIYTEVRSCCGTVPDRSIHISVLPASQWDQLSDFLRQRPPAERGVVVSLYLDTQGEFGVIGPEQDTAYVVQEPAQIRNRLVSGKSLTQDHLGVGAQFRNRLNSGRGFFPQGTSTMPGYGPIQETAQLRRQ